MTFDDARRCATAAAAATGQEWAVVRMDWRDETTYRSVPIDYCDDVEFEAFCGKVLEVVEPC